MILRFTKRCASWGGFWRAGLRAVGAPGGPGRLLLGATRSVAGDLVFLGHAPADQGVVQGLVGGLVAVGRGGEAQPVGGHVADQLLHALAAAAELGLEVD